MGGKQKYHLTFYYYHVTSFADIICDVTYQNRPAKVLGKCASSRRVYGCALFAHSTPWSLTLFRQLHVRSHTFELSKSKTSTPISSSALKQSTPFLECHLQTTFQSLSGLTLCGRQPRKCKTSCNWDAYLLPFAWNPALFDTDRVGFVLDGAVKSLEGFEPHSVRHNRIGEGWRFHQAGVCFCRSQSKENKKKWIGC